MKQEIIVFYSILSKVWKASQTKFELLCSAVDLGDCRIGETKINVKIELWSETHVELLHDNTNMIEIFNYFLLFHVDSYSLFNLEFFYMILTFISITLSHYYYIFLNCSEEK